MLPSYSKESGWRAFWWGVLAVREYFANTPHQIRTQDLYMWHVMSLRIWLRSWLDARPQHISNLRRTNRVQELTDFPIQLLRMAGELLRGAMHLACRHRRAIRRFADSG